MLSGRLQLVKNGNILGTVGIGASVGDEPLFTNDLPDTNQYTVRAVSDCYLLESNTYSTANGVESKIKQSLEESGLLRDWEVMEKNMLYSYHQK